MQDLCLLGYEAEDETEHAMLVAEWENFAAVFFWHPAPEARLTVRRYSVLFRSKMPR